MFKPVDPKPNFARLEEEILKFWEKEKIFEKSLEKTRPQSVILNGSEESLDPSATPQDEKHKLFTFYDGPPFATGLPHYGHILASTIKDVIPRYQTMKGRFVRRRWGWDCHGLPIEEIVERELKISGKKQIEEIGIKKFNEICRTKVLEYVNEWRKTIRRIARWADFDNSYKTMDRDYMESVWWAFKEIYDKGLVYEGRKVLLYCPRCETPVSNFEVAMDNSYKDVTEEAAIVKFRLKSPLPNPPPQGEGNSSPLRGEDKGGGETYFLAWTTTPWTLPGNVVLAVGEKITYVIFRMSNMESRISNGNQKSTFHIPHSTFIVAKDRLPSIAPDAEIIKEIKGSDLVGLEYEPLFDIKGIKGGNGGKAEGKAYKVYAADFVNTEEGTGIVHTAVVYGEDDYALGMKERLPVVPLLDEKGKFNEKAPELIRDQYFKDAEKVIKRDLEARGLLFERKMHQHSYPHCWRCGTTLYYNAIPAWFINIQKIRKKLLKSNDKEINWFPEHLKHGRYEKSIEAAPDWNISRNRYWGNPMPIWRCGKCKKDMVIGSVKELANKAMNPTVIPGLTQNPDTGSRLGGRDDKNIGIDLHRPYIDEVVLKCDRPSAPLGASCGGEAKRITEIFDSWVEAGSMPFAEHHYPFENKEEFKSRFPAQFVAEYIAQTRAWFYVMHVISTILFGKAPFENVVTTGTILAEDGSKMSKSKNNYPDPWLVMEKYGVDALRFYLMNSVVMQADNLNFSEKDLAVAQRKVVLILWNIYNYFVTYANEAKWQPSSGLRPPSPEQGEEKSSPRRGRGKGEGVLDLWLEARLQELVNSITLNLDNYSTVPATRAIESFINDLSTWYLRRSRGRSDQDFFATLRHCLIVITKIIAPFMPYISEEIYRNLTPALSEVRRGGRERLLSVHLESWPETKKLSKKQEELIREMREIREIVEKAHALRAKAGVKLRQPLARLVISGLTRSSDTGSRLGGRDDKFSDELLDILKDEVNVKEIVYGDKLELDTNLDENLKLEGLTAELTRQIQAFRKESGLKVGETAELYYETGSAIIERALENIDRKKTYLTNIESGISNLDGAKEMEIEGNQIKLKFQSSNVKSNPKLK